MAGDKIDEARISDHLQNSNQHPGFDGITHLTTSLFHHGGKAAHYLGELEQFMQAVDDIETDVEKKAVHASEPPTLEMFPSWPIESLQSTQQAGSSDSGSAQHAIFQLELESPISGKNSSWQSAGQTGQKPMTSQASKIGAEPTLGSEVQAKTKVVGSKAHKERKVLDQRTLRRLAQNREAARKSRLRKKVYIEQLESSKIRLQKLEQDLQRARTQGLFLGAGGVLDKHMSSGAELFDIEYNQWLEENQKRISELQGALHYHLPDNDLQLALDYCLSHYNYFFELKAMAIKSDMFHLFAGTWRTPAERCFQWIGGFKPSGLLKILLPKLESLTEQQLDVICSLQQSLHQSEDALSQGLEQLYDSLSKTIASKSLEEGNDVGDVMGIMATALGNLTNLQGILKQADNLRQETLNQLRHILTIRQAARCFLAVEEYYSRLTSIERPLGFSSSRNFDECSEQLPARYCSSSSLSASDPSVSYFLILISIRLKKSCIRME